LASPLDAANELLRSFRQEIGKGVSSRAEFERLKGRYLGREKGLVPGLFAQLKTLAPAERAAFGEAANGVKREIEAAIGKLATDLENREAAARDLAAAVDVTLPGRKIGRAHV